MKAELDYYFEQELRFLREAILQYAADHPQAAAKLQIDQHGESYADIERIVHGAALLNARTACKLEDGQSEFVESLFNVLFPHFLRPVPSLAITQFVAGPALAAQPGQLLQQEKHQLLMESESGELCRFQLADDFDVLPLIVNNVRLSGPPYSITPDSIPSPKQVSALQFRIQRTANELPIRDVRFGRFLRLFIREDRAESFELYEFLLSNIQGIAFSLPGNRAPFAVLPPSGLRPTGLDDSERLLRSDARTFPGFGLLTEFFAFPGRFNFLDLEVPDLTPCGVSPSFDVHIFLKAQSSLLEAKVKTGWLEANCIPCLNIFKPGDGVVSAPYSPSTHETPIVASASMDQVDRRQDSLSRLSSRYEIYSVDGVELYNRRSQVTLPVAPLFSVPNLRVGKAAELFYSVRREYISAAGGRTIVGSDVFLETTHPSPLSVAEAGDLNYRIHVRVMNRQVPLYGEVTIWVDEPVDGLEVRFLRNPTSAIRPYRPARELWRLVNHVALNQSTLLNTDALKQLLSIYLLYEVAPGKSTALLINAIQSIDWKRGLHRIFVDRRFAFVYGLDVTVRISKSELPPGKGYLLAEVLARFLIGCSSISSFISVAVQDENRSEIGRWEREGFSSET